MVTVLFILVLAIALVVGASRWGSTTSLAVLGGFALTSGLACFAFLYFGPKDYMIRWPVLAEVAHPYVLILYSAAGILIGIGVLVGLGTRRLLDRRRRDTGRPETS